MEEIYANQLLYVSQYVTTYDLQNIKHTVALLLYDA
jgi:hypothetical protein